MTPGAPLNSARRRACGNVGNPAACPQSHEAEQKQKKRTVDVLPKPDNFIRYRQNWLGGAGQPCGDRSVIVAFGR